MAGTLNNDNIEKAGFMGENSNPKHCGLATPSKNSVQFVHRPAAPGLPWNCGVWLRACYFPDERQPARERRPIFRCPSRMHPIKVLLCAVLFLACQAAPGAPSSDQAPSPEVRRLIEEHCFDCHGDGAKKGNFSLENLLEKGSDDADRATWQKAWKLARQGFMPPADADPMPEHERKII